VPGARPPGLSRGVAEVEAESVAYLVTAELGFDSSAYTIPYVTGWSEGDVDLVLATAQRAVDAARAIGEQVADLLGRPTPSADRAVQADREPASSNPRWAGPRWFRSARRVSEKRLRSLRRASSTAP